MLRIRDREEGGDINIKTIRNAAHLAAEGNDRDQNLGAERKKRPWRVKVLHHTTESILRPVYRQPSAGHGGKNIGENSWWAVVGVVSPCALDTLRASFGEGNVSQVPPSHYQRPEKVSEVDIITLMKSAIFTAAREKERRMKAWSEKKNQPKAGSIYSISGEETPLTLQRDNYHECANGTPSLSRPLSPQISRLFTARLPRCSSVHNKRRK